MLPCVKPGVQFIRLCHLFTLSTDLSRCRYLSSDPEEDDFEVPDEGLHQHAKPLPLPVRQSPAGVDGLPLQHALLHRLHGAGIQSRPKIKVFKEMRHLCKKIIIYNRAAFVLFVVLWVCFQLICFLVPDLRLSTAAHYLAANQSIHLCLCAD